MSLQFNRPLPLWRKDVDLCPWHLDVLTVHACNWTGKPSASLQLYSLSKHQKVSWGWILNLIKFDISAVIICCYYP